MLEAHEVIGMDEVPPSTFEFNPRALVLVDLSAYEPPCEAWELIGFDEDPPSDYVPMVSAREFKREPMAVCEAVGVLDAAYDAGVESDAVFLSWLHEVDVPACEARDHIAAWRSTHPDPWIWAHSYAFDSERELACQEGA